MRFLVRYVLTYTQSVGKRHAFWTALERVVKEIPEHEQLFVLMDANASTGRRGGGSWGVRSVNFSVPTTEILSTLMVGCLADHEQDWQPYPRLIHTLAICVTIHTYMV